MVASQLQTENEIRIELVNGQVFSKTSTDVLDLLNEFELDVCLLIVKEELREFFFKGLSGDDEVYLMKPEQFSILFDDQGRFLELEHNGLN